MKNLVIVESPTKAKTISKYLGSDYSIKASMGHIMDLPKSTLGVDLEHNFKPQYELMKDKEKIIEELKEAAKSAKSIILATDPDREGEAIASHIKDMLGSNSKFTRSTSSGQNSKFKRIVFHEITKEAIEEALTKPRDIDLHLVDAQTGRRVLDRLVGYKLSPLLWRKVRRGLSAGRVQSVALRLIVEREKEIKKFKKEIYFTIFADFKKQGKEEVRFELIEINSEKIELQKTFNLYDGEYKISKTIIEKENEAQKIVANLKKEKFIVADVIQKEMRRCPQPPYTTSTLQQDGARRLGLSGKRTMSLAQKLYEEGYITYHRTDSVNIASSAQNALINFIKKEFGEKYLPEKPRFYTAKQKLAQEAHEAIRPTKISNSPSVVSREVGRDYAKLYDLIWKRAVASQMADAVIESTTVLVDTGITVLSSHAETTDKNSSVGDSSSLASELSRFSSGSNIHLSRSSKSLPSSSENFISSPRSKKNYRLKANGSVLTFAGFLKVNPQALQDNKLPQFKVAEKLNLINTDKEFHETPPPPRYNDASLIKTLEEKGIGRPSTYATIISTIEGRRYIEKAEGRFAPTPVGIAVNDFLVDNFSEIDDVPFTAQMEDELDNVANGQEDWEKMMKTFYTPFAKKLKEVKDAKRVKIEVEKTDEKCEKCGAFLVIRIGRFGKFLSCSKFPKCDFTKSLVEETNLFCPKCKGKIIIKKTKKGRKFYGCANYPNCDFAAWKIEEIKKS